MSNSLTLQDGTEIKRGDLIHIASRSYRFIDTLDETSVIIPDGESDGVYMFLEVLPDKNAILVAEKNGMGSYFIWIGPDKIGKYGTHIRAPEITLPRQKKIKGVKRRKKTPHPDAIAGKEKNKKQKEIVESTPRKSGRPPKKDGESNRKSVGEKRKRGRPRKGV